MPPFSTKAFRICSAEGLSVAFPHMERTGGTWPHRQGADLAVNVAVLELLESNVSEVALGARKTSPSGPSSGWRETPRSACVMERESRGTTLDGKEAQHTLWSAS